MSSSVTSSSPMPTRKKRQRRAKVESSDSSDDHDTSDADSASEDSEDSDAPRPLPPTVVTVLSHAGRRRQKKKQKQQLASASESPYKKRKLDDGTASPSIAHKAKTKSTVDVKTETNASRTADDPRRPKRQNSVWVGNLSFRTTQDALRGFFEGVGTITRIHMPIRCGKQIQGENMGFAYVDFETQDAKVIAITLSEGQLDGRNLLIKDGDDFTGRPAKVKTGPSESANEKVDKNGPGANGKGLSKVAQKILHAQKQPPAPTLFLGNLGFETTEESIRELFEAHRYWRKKNKGKDINVDVEVNGELESQGGDGVKSKDVWIRKIRMGTFEDSGTCKGFAFVDFTSIEHATEALVNPRNHRLNGRDLVVEYASPDAVRRGGGGPRPPKGDLDSKSGSRGRTGSGKVPTKGTASEPYTRQHRPRHTEQEDNVEVPEEVTPTPGSRQPRAGHDRAHTRRARPGAVLAQAQRQSAAIVASQGEKIVF